LLAAGGPLTAHRRPRDGGRHDRQPLRRALSGLREQVENLASWLVIWENRREPDAFARRCASDAVDAVDAALRDLYLIRGHLTAETRQADDTTAARADALLTRTHEDGACSGQQNRPSES
jgi:hypothetical protein